MYRNIKLIYQWSWIEAHPSVWLPLSFRAGFFRGNLPNYLERQLPKQTSLADMMSINYLPYLLGLLSAINMFSLSILWYWGSLSLGFSNSLIDLFSITVDCLPFWVSLMNDDDFSLFLDSCSLEREIPLRWDRCEVMDTYLFVSIPAGEG